jgi:hypothetical protein
MKVYMKLDVRLGPRFRRKEGEGKRGGRKDKRCRRKEAKCDRKETKGGRMDTRSRKCPMLKSICKFMNINLVSRFYI